VSFAAATLMVAVGHTAVCPPLGIRLAQHHIVAARKNTFACFL